MKLKICGIRTQEMYDFCIENQIDFMGFNFVSHSKRKVDIAICRDMSVDHNKSNSIALFLDQSIDEIINIYTNFKPKIIQLHGIESPKFCKNLRQSIPSIKIWKAFRIDEKFDPKILELYKDVVDLFLFDGSSPGSGKTITNSNLVTLDEAIVYSQKHDIPYGIAGGIDSENIKQFIKKYPKAYLLDLASGIETNGEFDARLAQKIIYSLRQP